MNQTKRKKMKDKILCVGASFSNANGHIHASISALTFREVPAMEDEAAHDFVSGPLDLGQIHSIASCYSYG